MASRRRSSQPARPRGPLVLVVDDNEDARDMYSLYIRHVGLRVVTASDGEEALVKANRLMPDVIVMDLTMPGMDGWTATRVMKRDPRLRSIPVIALTGHAMMGAEDDALAAGCDRYVVKPCLPEELVAVIRELVAPGGGTRRRA